MYANLGSTLGTLASWPQERRLVCTGQTTPLHGAFSPAETSRRRNFLAGIQNGPASPLFYMGANKKAKLPRGKRL